MNRSRLPIVIVLVISLMGAHVTRRWAIASRSTGTATGGTSAAGLSRMNSFALALMLGGLRGPLVMILWPSAEREKNEKNLEDFDTKIEWIRMLQAEFDSVHIFQIWNKAYNISVQMANVGNKYVTILDALDYGRRTDAERPNNINIITEIARLYGDKLGSSTEKSYYRQRVRDETRARQPMVRVTLPASRQAEFEKLANEAGLPPPRLRYSIDESRDLVSATIPKSIAEVMQPKLNSAEVSFVERTPAPTASGAALKRRELDPLLDSEGRLLPQYVTPRFERPAGLPADSEWNDGSELQYLKPFEPFPYGVSSMALGYNYYKRAQVLQSVHKQQHVQVTETVVDRSPPLNLRYWAEDEWERGRRAEIEGLGLIVPPQREEMETVTAETMPDAAIVYRSLIDEAIYSYDRAASLIDAAIAEYGRHMAVDKSTYSIYLVHLDEIQALQELVRADRDFLKLIVAPGDQQSALRASAIKHYNEAARRYRLHGLKYYVSEELAATLLPPNMTRANIDKANLEPAELDRLLTTAFNAIQKDPTASGYYEIAEFNRYISRAMARLSNLGT